MDITVEERQGSSTGHSREQRTDQISDLILRIQHGDEQAVHVIHGLFMPELQRWVSWKSPYREEIIQDAWEDLIMAIIRAG